MKEKKIYSIKPNGENWFYIIAERIHYDDGIVFFYNDNEMIGIFPIKSLSMIIRLYSNHDIEKVMRF